VLIPIIFLMTDPTSPEASSWVQDVETTKALLTHPSLSNNHLAARCLDVINRLCSPVYAQNTEQSEAQQQFLMQPSGQLFNDTAFGLFQNEYGGNGAGVDFSEWVNFASQDDFT
jgi:transcriptional regulatory protein GAL4